MGTRIGLIAGGGDFPLYVLTEAKKGGRTCVVAALRGAASPDLRGIADELEWFGPTEIEKLTAFLKSRGIRETVLVGKVEHRMIFQTEDQGGEAARLLSALPDRTPTAVLKTLIEYLAANGLPVLDPTPFLAPFLLPEGSFGGEIRSASVSADIAFGWPPAKALADLDIGQTLVVKGQAVAAVEGMEGTDETIRRGARLAGDGVIVLKVGRTRQDMRIDVPAVGLETVRTLVRARAAALVIEAGKVPFFQTAEASALAAAEGLALIVKR